MQRSNINLAILLVRPAMDLQLSALHVQQVSVEGEAMESERMLHPLACTLMEVCVQMHSTDLVPSQPPITEAPGDTHSKTVTNNPNGPPGTKKCFLL